MGPSWKQTWELRTSLYAFLGNTLLEPMRVEASEGISPAFWSGFPLQPANEAMERALFDLARLAERFAELPIEEAASSIAIDYTQLFLGPAVVRAPLWESLYREGGRYLFGQPTFEMRELFRAYGLKLEESVRQFEDHMGVELLFLSATSSRFAACAPKADDVDALERFIDAHPLHWVEDLLGNIVEYETTGYYSGIARLSWGVLLWDKELLQEYRAQMER